MSPAARSIKVFAIYLGFLSVGLLFGVIDAVGAAWTWRALGKRDASRA